MAGSGSLNSHESKSSGKQVDGRSKQEDDEFASLNLRNLSKLILPPLGVSSFNRSQIEPKGRIISPMDSRYRSWEAFMVVLVAYSAWVYPFEVAFMNATPKGGLCIADNIIDAFFAIDIVLTFFVAYIDSRTQLLIQNQRKIAISERRSDVPPGSDENASTARKSPPRRPIYTARRQN